ncbi:hypothetical protein M9458_019129, partial [Cirrhinus mrigala]
KGPVPAARHEHPPEKPRALMTPSPVRKSPDQPLRTSTQRATQRAPPTAYERQAPPTTHGRQAPPTIHGKCSIT